MPFRDATSLLLFYHDPLPVNPGDQLLQGLEREGTVPDELTGEVDAVPPTGHVDLDLGLRCQRMALCRFVI